MKSSADVDAQYVSERLSRAMHALATGRGPIRERLAVAYLSGLSTVEPEQLDDEDDRSEFEDIERLLNEVPATGDEGTVAATLAEMSDDQAVEIAGRVADLEAHYTHRWCTPVV